MRSYEKAQIVTNRLKNLIMYIAMLFVPRKSFTFTLLVKAVT